MLPPKQRGDVEKAMQELEGSGLSLLEAVRFAKKHHRNTAQSETVAQAIEILLEEKERENLKPRSIADLKNRLGLFAERFGKREVHLLKTEELQHWVNDLQAPAGDGAKPLSARSRKNYTVTLKTFFNFAILKGWRAKGDNPADALTIPKIDWKPPAILNVDEARRLMHAAVDFNDGEMLAFVALGLFAGIRSSELALLNWSQIDLEEGIITIGADIAKKRRLRIVELGPNAIAWLKLSPIKTGPIALVDAKGKLSALVKAAGFTNWREEKSNAMRHSFGTYHYALHQNAALTSAALGHRDGDQVLFDSYRSLARKKDGAAYFNIYPSGQKKA